MEVILDGPYHLWTLLDMETLALDFIMDGLYCHGPSFVRGGRCSP